MQFSRLRMGYDARPGSCKSLLSPQRRPDRLWRPRAVSAEPVIRLHLVQNPKREFPHVFRVQRFA
jgi:hypothetical protein